MRKSYLFFILLFLGINVDAQKKNSITDSAYFSNTQFRLIGPFRGGRCAAVCGDPVQKNIFYMGTTGGGVWKTTDGGNNWKNISDKYFGGSIGSVAVAPSDASIIYVGEGENTMRGNVSEGNGIWKSTDGGRTWKHIGLKDTRHITRIIIHPKNPDMVWVAATGHLFGPNEERGVFKSADGGKTWKKVLFANQQAGAIDLVMEPGNSQTLYASTWRVIRTPYSLESGGEGSALWKSTDGGETWKSLMNNKGMPKNEIIGIIGITVSPTNPDRVYAIIECKSGGVYRSDDGGFTWSKQSEEANIRQRAWYFSKIFADPKNENTIYALNVGFYRSRDGAKSFQQLHTAHPDHHDLWIDPNDANRMIIAHDGGAQVSFDGGANWSTTDNQPTAQFYRVSTDNNFPYRVLGAQQDNSSVRIKSRTYAGAITAQDWEPTAGFESGYIVADPLNPEVVYGGNYGGYLSRLDHKTGENRTVSVWPDVPIGAGAEGLKYRFQWNFPVFFSPHNPKRLYAAANVLFVTEDEGQTWKPISPDLTTNDKTKQLASGGPITKDNTSVEYYCTIFTAAESPSEKDLLWTGSDDGLIHVSKDGGKNWENVTPKDCPKWMMWNCVEPDPHKKGAAYFVGTRYKSDDFTPYIYKTEDYGKTWKLITGGIEKNHFTRCLRADRKKPGVLYCGTEYGLYISYDDGKSWKKFQLNLPIVPITDMTIKNNDLVIATQGRSFWILDDLHLVQYRKEDFNTAKNYVFAIPDAYRMDGYSTEHAGNNGKNPSNGSVINYYLKDVNDSSKISITILDAKQKKIKTFSTSDAENKLEVQQGMNRFVWNMEYPPAEKSEGVMWNGGGFTVKAPPGDYIARFKQDNDSVDMRFTILPDPNYKISIEDYQEQHDFLMQVTDKFNEVQKTLKRIKTLRADLTELKDKANKSKHKELIDLIDKTQKEITAIEETLVQTKAKSGQDLLNYPIKLNDKIAGVFYTAASGYNPPNQQVRDVFTELSAQADVELSKFKKVKEENLKQINEMIHKYNITMIDIK